MGTPFPNPQDGAATKKKQDQGAGRPRKARAAVTKRHQDILAMPPLQVPTKFQYVSLEFSSLNTPGPSGIKQCFRTVKSIRRIPILPRVLPDPPVPYPTPGPTPVPRKGKKHTCRFCSKRFSSPGKLAQHTLSHTGELPFACQHCNKKFNSKFKLVRHGLIHSETRPFSCPSCHKTFHRKDHLSNHERIHNPLKSVYICDKDNCKKQYTSQLSFKKHSALHSAEEGNLQCKICNKTFDNQADIVYHLKVHAGSRTIKNENDKKFKCPNCDRKFFTGKDVRRHLVVHTRTREFPCQFCKQDFGRKDHLVRHVKKAHPNEPWQSATPGSSSSFVESPEPVPIVSKKGKGEAKKSKTKAELKFPRKVSESGDASLKTEQLSGVLEPAEEVFHYDTLGGSDILSGDIISQQEAIFLPCEGLVQIKLEPLLENVKMEETISSRLYESMPSTSKDIRPLLLPPVEPRPSTSLGKYEEYDSGILYMMSPNIEMMQELDVGRDTLAILDQPVVDSMIGEEGDHSVFTSQQIMSLLDSGTPPHDQHSERIPEQTVLPAFEQAFLNTTQSPKPPQHPPK